MEEKRESTRIMAELNQFQWVHGQRTVVMGGGVAAGSENNCQFQWVHGQRTVVMVGCDAGKCRRCMFQWVHGQRTVVMAELEPPALTHSGAFQWVHGQRTVVMVHLRG